MNKDLNIYIENFKKHFNEMGYKYVTHEDTNQYYDDVFEWKHRYAKGDFIRLVYRRLDKSKCEGLYYNNIGRESKTNYIVAHQTSLFEKETAKKNNDYYFMMFARWFLDNYPEEVEITEKHIRLANTEFKTGLKYKDFALIIDRHLKSEDMTRQNFFFIEGKNDTEKRDKKYLYYKNSYNYKVEEQRNGKFCIMKVNFVDGSAHEIVQEDLVSHAVASRTIKAMIPNLRPKPSTPLINPNFNPILNPEVNYTYNSDGAA